MAIEGFSLAGVERSLVYAAAIIYFYHGSQSSVYLVGPDKVKCVCVFNLATGRGKVFAIDGTSCTQASAPPTSQAPAVNKNFKAR